VQILNEEIRHLQAEQLNKTTFMFSVAATISLPLSFFTGLMGINVGGMLSNDDFIPMTNRLRTTLLNRQKSVDGEYVFPGRYGSHKTIQNNRALEAAFRRSGLTDVSSHNMRKTFATRLLSRGAAITDVQHLLGHASVKTTERAYAAFVKNERFKQTIDLLDTPTQPMLKIVK
jgi:integrase